MVRCGLPKTAHAIACPKGSPRGLTARCGSLNSTSTRSGESPPPGVVTEYAVPFPAGLGFSPWGITAGLGALWFAAGFGVIGRIANAGVITEYQMMNETDLRGITAGDGELWFADSFDSSIGQAGFVTAGLSVSPASGAVPTPLTFTGSAFAPDETVSIYARGIGAGLLAT